MLFLKIKKLPSPQTEMAFEEGNNFKKSLLNLYDNNVNNDSFVIDNKDNDIGLVTFVLNVADIRAVKFWCNCRNLSKRSSSKPENETTSCN